MFESGIKDEIRKGDRTVSYTERVEAFESVPDTANMSGEEAARAKVKLLRDALSGRYPDTSKMSEDDQKKVQRIMDMEEVSMGSFTMLMRLRYLEGKLPQEGK